MQLQRQLHGYRHVRPCFLKTEQELTQLSSASDSSTSSDSTRTATITASSSMITSTALVALVRSPHRRTGDY